MSLIEKSRKMDVGETEIKNTNAIIEDIEKAPKTNKVQLCKSKIVGFFTGSRFAGIPLAIIYGAYVYYMISFVILSGPLNLNPTEMGKNETDVNGSNYR